MVQLRRDIEDYQDDEADERAVEVFEYILERSLAEFDISTSARSVFARIACQVLRDHTLLDVPQRDTRYKLLKKISTRDTSCIPVAEKFLAQIVEDAFPEKFFAVARQDDRSHLLRMLHVLGAGDVDTLEHQLNIYDWMNDRVQDIVRRMRLVGMDNARFQKLCRVENQKVVCDEDGAENVFNLASDSKELFSECHGILEAILGLVLPRINNSNNNTDDVMGQLYLDGSKELQFRDDSIYIGGVGIGWLASELLARYIALYRQVEILAAKHLELPQATRTLLAERLVVDKDGIMDLNQKVEPIDGDEYDNTMEWLGRRVFMTLFEKQSLLEHEFKDMTMVLDDEVPDTEPSTSLPSSNLEDLFPRKRPFLFTEGKEIKFTEEDEAMVHALELEAMC